MSRFIQSLLRSGLQYLYTISTAEFPQECTAATAILNTALPETIWEPPEVHLQTAEVYVQEPEVQNQNKNKKFFKKIVDRPTPFYFVLLRLILLFFHEKL